MRRTPFDAILFDFDGVLADTEPLHFACWREALAEIGVRLDPSRAVEFVGVSDRAMIERIADEQGRSADPLWAVYARKRTLFRERIAGESPIPAEVIRLLVSTHPKYKLAVVSSSDRLEIEPPLVQANVRALFQALVCGNEVLNLKPAPDPYLRAAELLGASHPLVVEDSDAGVASGRAAGFEVLRISGPLGLGRALREVLDASSFQPLPSKP